MEGAELNANEDEFGCGARECSMINTMVKLLSAQVFCLGNQLACVSRCPPQQVDSALAPLQNKKTVFLLSEFRQASERQELAGDTRCSPVYCLDSEVADLDFEEQRSCNNANEEDEFGHCELEPKGFLNVHSQFVDHSSSHLLSL